MLDNHRRGDAKDLGFQRRVLQAVSEQDVRSPLVECSYSSARGLPDASTQTDGGRLMTPRSLLSLFALQKATSCRCASAGITLSR